MKKGLILMMLLFTAVASFAQKVNGVVTSSTDGLPLPGVTVLVKGTTTGTITGMDGDYSLNAPSDATLIYSFIGFTTQEVAVAGQTTINVVLEEETAMLEDLVVIGYGVQKKSVVTASIAKVSAEDLAGKAPVRMDNALKGLAAGVNVTSSSGAPGAAANVRVRGTGTINDANPLYIVDGMPIEGGLDFLSPSDIESIEVLKDAASGAVYGARAANGVILVTTKSGKEGKVAVNYNFSYGLQTKWRKRDVLDATEYGIMMNEGRLNSGRAVMYDDPYALGKGTDWQDEIFYDNAPVMNHEVNASGASDKLNYYFSYNYFSQDGIVGGDHNRSNYRRMTIRSNTKYTLFDDTKERDWINKLMISANLSYSKIKSVGVSENGGSNAILNSTITMAPVLPVYYSGKEAEEKLAEYSTATNYVPQYDEDGNLYMVPGVDYDNQFNPVAYLNVPCLETWGWSHKFVANFAANLDLGYGLKYRISYGTDMSFWGSESYKDKYYLTSSFNWGGKTSASANSDRGLVWQLENVLSWDKDFDMHSVSVVLGQSAKKSTGYHVNGGKNYLVDVNKPYVDYTTGHEEGDVWSGAAPSDVATLASLFARVSYNYDERYMFQGTIRRDGSSRFGANNHYGIFPSVSVGWNVSNEAFMESRPEWFTKLKVRASWGRNGNESIGNYRYSANTTNVGSNSIIVGKGEDITKVIGTRAGGLSNPNLKWEESEQTNFGLDFAFLSNALTFGVDYYIKKTNGMLMDVPIPSYVGVVPPVGNVGEMKNSGVELELGYNGRVDDFKYNVKANFAYLKNELVNLGNESGTQDYDYVQSIGTITRAKNGEEFPYFYGYKTAGVFQNMAEINSYVNKDNQKIMPDAVPGDLIFVDTNNDGVITEEDKTKIGKGTPDWTFGFNVGAEWKGFDFSMFWQGTIGNDIYDATIRVDKENQNLPSWMLGRWTGEGTSNKVPRYVLGANKNFVSSDMFVFDGSYLRLKNIQLGYTLPKELTTKFFVDRLRVYVMTENLLTFTKYHGYDPEISSSGKSLGVDYGVYPQARTLTFGANISF